MLSMQLHCAFSLHDCHCVSIYRCADKQYYLLLRVGVDGIERHGLLVWRGVRAMQCSDLD
jgi:hypothetical protein